MSGSTEKLLNSVHSRLKTNAFLRTLNKTFIILGCLYLVAILIKRFTGYLPDIFSLQMSAAPLLGAFLVACLWPNKITQTDAARAIDTHANSDDLFLTSSTIQSASGEFKSLIADQADKQAVDLKAAKIAVIQWQKPLQFAVITLITLLIFTQFMPQLDPFGKEQERAKKEEKKKVMDEERDITAKRLAVLKKQKELPKDSDEIKAELTKIFKDFKKMPPKENVKKVREERRKIAKLWNDKNRDLQSEKKSNQLKSQHFGTMSEEMKKITQDLKSGDTESAASKLKKLAKDLEDLEDLSNIDDEEKRQAKADEIKKQMADIKDALSDNLGADSVKAAIDRAMRQMDGLSDEAKEALKDAAKSMELSSRELQRLQKLMDEMDELKKMMQTAQNAEQYAQQQQGQNQQGQNGQSPEYENFRDYEQFFNEQQGQQCEDCTGSGQCKSCDGTGKGADGKECQDCKGKGSCGDCKGSGKKGSGQQMAGQGSGTGNPGQGGGIPGENDDIETDFKKEQSKSKKQPGKILMQWKTKGLSDKGEVTVEYQEAMSEIKAGVDEAIAKEKIPPGYHDVIKKYFSTDQDEAAVEK